LAASGAALAGRTVLNILHIREIRSTLAIDALK
jgi:hypothetical protein